MTWAAYAFGTYSVTISHWQPDSSPGLYYIGVYADCADQPHAASYTVTATVAATDDDTDIYLHSGLSKEVKVGAGEYKNFRFCMPAHKSSATNPNPADAGVVVVGGNNNVASNHIVIASVISGTLAPGVVLSGVGVVGKCTILKCYDKATITTAKTESYASPAGYTTALLCTLDSTQTLPGPVWYEVSTTTLSASQTAMIILIAAATDSADPAAGMVLHGFGTSEPVAINLIQSCEGPASVSLVFTCKLGYSVVMSSGYLGAAGALLHGMKQDPEGVPDFANPLGMAKMRGKSTNYKGDACMDAVVTWSMTTSDGRAKYPDVLLSRTTPSLDTNGYVWRRSDYNAYGMTVISHEELTARDANGYLSGSWFLGMYGWCAYSAEQNRGKSFQFDDDDYYQAAGRCLPNDASATVTVSVSFVPRKFCLPVALAVVVPLLLSFVLCLCLRLRPLPSLTFFGLWGAEHAVLFFSELSLSLVVLRLYPLNLSG